MCIDVCVWGGGACACACHGLGFTNILTINRVSYCDLHLCVCVCGFDVLYLQVSVDPICDLPLVHIHTYNKTYNNNNVVNLSYSFSNSSKSSHTKQYRFYIKCYYLFLIGGILGSRKLRGG